MIESTVDDFDFFQITLKMLFVAAHTETTAETIYLFEGSEIVFKRTMELHIELIEAIILCLFGGKIRPAYGLLRMLLESCANFSWMILKYEERVSSYITGTKNITNIKHVFNEINWSKEYNSTYRKLCSFVHGSYSHADIKKNVTIYDAPPTETVEDTITADYFVSLSPLGNKVIVVDEKPLAEIIQEHRKVLELKVFDISMAALIRVSGPYADSHSWWPSQSIINCFSSFAKTENFKFPFLWNKEKHNLTICKVDGKYL